MGNYSVYPTGTTVYNPEKAYNGYTVYPAREYGAVLINMNGEVVHVWEDLQGFPNKLLPGGGIFGHLGVRNTAFGYQDQTDLVQVDWDGHVVWKFDHLEFIQDPGETPMWMARQHHDYQRSGNPVGYYVPGMDPLVNEGNTLILCHHNVQNPRISDKMLVDDCIIEVDWEGNILWRWNCHEHFSEFGFSEQAKNVIYRNPNIKEVGTGDWMHINSMSTLGPNKWYDAGDERFHPNNIIWDGRETNISGIISKETGKIVWQIGPDYTSRRELRMLKAIIGQHHVHMIPRGLPGEGNILIFDNGGWGGYGYPSQNSTFGLKSSLRDHSRVLEIDPITLKVVWECSAATMGHPPVIQANWFYSPLVSSCQRLPNGNTLITEGTNNRIFEVTFDNEIVWEYINPYYAKPGYIYRAYRYPYDYVPQLETPNEVAVIPPENHSFRVSGAANYGLNCGVKVAGTTGWGKKVDMCVNAEDILTDGGEKKA